MLAYGFRVQGLGLFWGLYDLHRMPVRCKAGSLRKSCIRTVICGTAGTKSPFTASPGFGSGAASSANPFGAAAPSSGNIFGNTASGFSFGNQTSSQGTFQALAWHPQFVNDPDHDLQAY